MGRVKGAQNKMLHLHQHKDSASLKRRREDRAEARRRARQRTRAKRQDQRFIDCRFWEEAKPLQVQWATICHAFVATLVCCAYCASVAFGGTPTAAEYSLQPGGPTRAPPAFWHVPHLHDHMIDGNSGDWWVCPHCFKSAIEQNARFAYLTTFTPQYANDVLAVPHSELGYLSIVDIAVDIENKYLGFHEGTVFRRSLLNAPLIQINPFASRTDVASFAAAFANIYLFNMRTNPLYLSYKTMFERARGLSPAFPCLPAEAFSSFLAQIRERGIMYNTAQQHSMPHVQLGLAMDAHPLPVQNGATDFYIVGNLIPRASVNDIEPLALTIHGTPAFDSSTVGIEQALFPFLFPHGCGFWIRGRHNWSLNKYLKYRMTCLFSLFTMCKIYPLVMYAVRQCQSTSQNVRIVQLEEDIAKYRRKHPNASEEDIYTHVVKHCMPSQLSGTPCWYRQHLNDLLTYVEHHGMPHLFLTLTSDEVSSTRWEEIRAMQHLGSRMVPSATFSDMPVESALLFHVRLWKFLNTHILCNKDSRGGLLGRVEHYVVRYEVQNRNSLHAHIILWLHPDDVDEAVEDICAYVPSTWNADMQCWNTPKDGPTRDLLQQVLQKQIHKCSKEGCCKRFGHCQYGFPFSPQPNRKPVYNPTHKRFDYCRKDARDRNVVPYHPLVLLLWGAHMNLQKITHEAWTYYCLKYAMKAEPSGKLNLNTEFAKKMNLQNVPESILKAFFATHMSRPMSSSEVALHLLDKTTVYRDQKVHFVASQPPHLRMRRVHVGSAASLSAPPVTHTYARPVDEYMSRPPSLEAVTFYDYFRFYEAVKGRRVRFSCVGQDGFGHNVYRLPENKPRLVRMSDFHPAHNPEAYFYNVLLRSIPFRREQDLLSPENNTGSFVHECYIRSLLTDEQSLLAHITDYTTRHLYQDEQQQALLHKMMSSALGTYLGCPVDQRGDTPFPVDPTMNVLRMQTDDNEGEHMGERQRVQTCTFGTEFKEELAGKALTADQQAIFDSVLASPTGMHAIQGVPGAGKSLMAKHFAKTFEEQQKHVVMCATTGAAAARLSKRATTAHALFHVPATGGLPFLCPNASVFQRLLLADVIIIDEYSMLTSQFLCFILYRLQYVCASLNLPVSSKLILFFGDPAQLPPVCEHCKHSEDDHNSVPHVCDACHVTSHTAWPSVRKHRLQASLRHAQDPVFLAFLNYIRSAVPTMQQLNAVLSDNVLQEREVDAYLATDCTVLCSHRRDAHMYNSRVLRNRFAWNEIHQIHLQTNAIAEIDLESWLQDDRFHTLTAVAVGARVMITANLDTTIGAANGSTGTVTHIKRKEDGFVYGITVRLDSGKDITVYQLKARYTRHQGLLYFKHAFPLALAYAMTGHKAQGATIRGNILLHVRSAFCPGLLYVMLSRVLTRSQIKLVQQLQPAQFIPIPSKYLQ